MSATHLSNADVQTWYQAGDRPIFLADVVDASHRQSSMSVGFARYSRGASNAWTVTYDEALVITRGAFSVRTDQGIVTARAGEVILLTKGTKVEYLGEEDGTELVYVTHPHWAEAQRASEHAALMDEFHPLR
jgi:ethanolamine utilization protein EutQ